MELMLLSNSGTPYLAYAADLMVDFMGAKARCGFVSAARIGGDAAELEYFEQAQTALQRTDNEIVHLRWNDPARPLLSDLDAVFVGGGNTFALLSRLRSSGLLPAIKEAVDSGLKYIGSSAGSNITGPSIMTTNDWNIVGATELDALGFVPWNINPHYFPGDMGQMPGTACREPRISEYHKEHANPVLAIEEQTGVFVDDNGGRLFGKGRARIFRADGSNEWFYQGQDIPLE